MNAFSYRVNLHNQYDVVVKKAKSGKTTTKALISFFEGRASAAEVYFKDLGKLLEVQISNEEKSFDSAFQGIFKSTKSSVLAHQDFAAGVRTDIINALEQLLAELRKEKKLIEQIEAQSQSSVTFSETEFKKSKIKAEKLRLRRIKAEGDATKNKGNTRAEVKLNNAVLDHEAAKQMEIAAEERMHMARAKHTKTLSSLLEKCEKLEVMRLNRTQTVLNRAAELQIQFSSHINSVTEIFTTDIVLIDARSDLQSFIQKHQTESMGSTTAVAATKLNNAADDNRVCMDMSDFLNESSENNNNEKKMIDNNSRLRQETKTLNSQINSDLNDAVSVFSVSLDNTTVVGVEGNNTMMVVSSVKSTQSSTFSFDSSDAAITSTITGPASVNTNNSKNNMMMLSDAFKFDSKWMFQNSPEFKTNKTLVLYEELLIRGCFAGIETMDRKHPDFFTFLHVRTTMGISGAMHKALCLTNAKILSSMTASSSPPNNNVGGNNVNDSGILMLRLNFLKSATIAVIDSTTSGDDDEHGGISEARSSNSIASSNSAAPTLPEEGWRLRQLQLILTNAYYNFLDIVNDIQSETSRQCYVIFADIQSSATGVLEAKTTNEYSDYVRELETHLYKLFAAVPDLLSCSYHRELLHELSLELLGLCFNEADDDTEIDTSMGGASCATGDDDAALFVLNNSWKHIMNELSPVYTHALRVSETVASLLLVQKLYTMGLVAPQALDVLQSVNVYTSVSPMRSVESKKEQVWWSREMDVGGIWLAMQYFYNHKSALSTTSLESSPNTLQTSNDYHTNELSHPKILDNMPCIKQLVHFIRSLENKITNFREFYVTTSDLSTFMSNDIQLIWIFHKLFKSIEMQFSTDPHIKEHHPVHSMLERSAAKVCCDLLRESVRLHYMTMVDPRSVTTATVLRVDTATDIATASEEDGDNNHISVFNTETPHKERDSHNAGSSSTGVAVVSVKRLAGLIDAILYDTPQIITEVSTGIVFLSNLNWVDLKSFENDIYEDVTSLVLSYVQTTLNSLSNNEKKKKKNHKDERKTCVDDEILSLLTSVQKFEQHVSLKVDPLQFQYLDGILNLGSVEEVKPSSVTTAAATSFLSNLVVPYVKIFLTNALETLITKCDESLETESFSPHTTDEEVLNDTPSSSVIDVFTMISQTLDGILDMFHQNKGKIPIECLEVVAQSVVDVACAYFDGLRRIAGTSTRFIPPIPPPPKQSLFKKKAKKYLSLKPFSKNGKSNSVSGNTPSSIGQNGNNSAITSNTASTTASRNSKEVLTNLDYKALNRLCIMLNNLSFASHQLNYFYEKILKCVNNTTSSITTASAATIGGSSSAGEEQNELFDIQSNLKEIFTPCFVALTSAGNDVADTLACRIVFKDLNIPILESMYTANTAATSKKAKSTSNNNTSSFELEHTLTDVLHGFDPVMCEIMDRMATVWFPVVLQFLFKHLSNAWHRVLLTSGRVLPQGTVRWCWRPVAEGEQDNNNNDNNNNNNQFKRCTDDEDENWIPYLEEVSDLIEENYNDVSTRNGAVQVTVGVIQHYITFDKMTAKGSNHASFYIQRKWGQYGRDLRSLDNFFVGYELNSKLPMNGLPRYVVDDKLHELKATISMMHEPSKMLIQSIKTMTNHHLKTRAKRILLHRDDKIAIKYCKSNTSK